MATSIKFKKGTNILPVTPDSAGKITDIKLVDTLPTTQESDVVYLVKSTASSTGGYPKCNGVDITTIVIDNTADTVASVSGNTLTLSGKVVGSGTTSLTTKTLAEFSALTPAANEVYLITD